MTNTIRRGGVALSLLVASSCLSIGGVQRADTMGRGNYQFTTEPGVHLALPPAGTQTIFGPVSFLLGPMIDFGARYGVSDGVDLGARIGTTGLDVNAKFLLTKPDDLNLAVSLNPTVGGFFFGLANAAFAYGTINFPVLIGFKFGHHELVLGPRLMAQFLLAGASSASAGAFVLTPGATVGFAISFQDIFTLLPEIGLAVPLIGGTGVNVAGMMGSAGNANQFFVPTVQFKVGFLVGRQRFADDLIAKPPPPLAPPPQPPVYRAPPPPYQPPPAYQPPPPQPPVSSPPGTNPDGLTTPPPPPSSL